MWYVTPSHIRPQIAPFFTRAEVSTLLNATQVEVPDGSDLWSDPSPTHMVSFQTKITGSGIWFERTLVWSEVTSIWGWCDQRSLPDGYSLIRGQGMAWSEADSSALRAHAVFHVDFSLTSGYFGLECSDQMLLLSGTIWSEVTFRRHLILGKRCKVFSEWVDNFSGQRSYSLLAYFVHILTFHIKS